MFRVLLVVLAFHAAPHHHHQAHHHHRPDCRHVQTMTTQWLCERRAR